MIQAPVTTFEGKARGTIDLESSVFEVPLRRLCLSEVVRWQLACRQAGTHATRGRGEVHGTTKKMYKQKGTGRARHGSRDVSQFRGGGVVFGPTPRSHAFKLNKKVRFLALKMLLSLKLKEENLWIVEDFSIPSGKTGALRALLEKRGWKSSLFVDAFDSDALFPRAVHNLPGMDVLPPEGLNVYDGLRHKKLILTRRAAEGLTKRLQRGAL
ncbi:MAG: 50S ribosomal protein L4 [Holosporales bacterium]|jgi:large subunit ribosomal protein L4|nr:50S ribosomal protein L4 [Holosporales bacterium]